MKIIYYSTYNHSRVKTQDINMLYLPTGLSNLASLHRKSKKMFSENQEHAVAFSVLDDSVLEICMLQDQDNQNEEEEETS